MLVKELIESLKYMDQDAEVHYAYNYGDHWRTEVAPAVGRVDEGAVVYSEYHRMDKVVDNSDSDFDEETGEEIVDETLRRVVVLS
jgi:hypothetical protein